MPCACAVAKTQTQVQSSPKGKRRGRRGKRKLPVDQEEEEEEGEGSVEAMEMTGSGPVLSSADTKTLNVRLKGLLQVSQCQSVSCGKCVLKMCVESEYFGEYCVQVHNQGTLTQSPTPLPLSLPSACKSPFSQSFHDFFPSPNGTFPSHCPSLYPSSPFLSWSSPAPPPSPSICSLWRPVCVRYRCRHKRPHATTSYLL